MDDYQLLHGLCNQIPNSAHSSVVQGHVEILERCWYYPVLGGLPD